jgi:hypothetical protein
VKAFEPEDFGVRQPDHVHQLQLDRNPVNAGPVARILTLKDAPLKKSFIDKIFFLITYSYYNLIFYILYLLTFLNFDTALKTLL